jgi:hypothetical protein
MVRTRVLFGNGLVGLLVVVFAGRAVGSQAPFSDVEVVMVAEVADSAAWLTLHQEVLGTPTNSPRVLRASLPSGTAGSRSLTIEDPKFAVAIDTAQAQWPVRVTVTGKVAGSEAIAQLTPFQHAALEVQAGWVQNELTLFFGLSGVVGRLLELQLGRQ